MILYMRQYCAMIDDADYRVTPLGLLDALTKLSGETQDDFGFAFDLDVSSCSITPRTCGPAQMFNVPGDVLENVLESILSGLELKGKIDEVKDLLRDNLERTFFYFAIYQENIKDATEIDKSLPMVARYGINVDYMPIIRKQLQELDLHPIERFLLDKAICYLNTNQSRHVVLVDILALEDDGFTKIKAMELETHTIVICKFQDRFYLIDPTTKKFSERISKAYTNPSVKVTNYSIDDFYRTKGVVTGYSSITDLNSNSYRDCIDIGVKIGIVLEEGFATGMDFEKAFAAAKGMLSNSEKNSDYLVKKGDNPVIRAMQSTNKDIRMQAAKLIRDIAGKKGT
jgi:hypothetical protein